MYIGARHIGGVNPSRIIEINIETGNASITEDITDLDGRIDQNFIDNLREIADELDSQNKSIELMEL